LFRLWAKKRISLLVLTKINCTQAFAVTPDVMSQVRFGIALVRVSIILAMPIQC